MEVITHIVQSMGYVGIFVWMAVSACLPIPSEAVLPFAGAMAVTQHSFNIHLLAWIGAIGNLVGSAIGYWIGASKGREVFEKYGRYVLISRKDIARGDKWFARHGEATVFFTRMLPVIRAVISYPAGIARMSFGKFCVYSFLGGLGWCYLLVWIGMSLGAEWQRVSTYFHKADMVIAVLIVAFVALWVYMHAKDLKEDRKLEAEQTAG